MPKKKAKGNGKRAADQDGEGDEATTKKRNTQEGEAELTAEDGAADQVELQTGEVRGSGYPSGEESLTNGKQKLIPVRSENTSVSS